jgi:hypothetical protein
MKDYFKYNEVKEYFNDFVAENSEALKDSDFRDDLHHHAFNTDYYIIGTYQAEQWLGNKSFDVIGIIKEYEESNFGEITTDLSSPESVVNMYAYIVGEEIVYDWLQANPLEEEQVAS